MSFQQGISGLNAAAKALDVSGNNISNASTVGFKSSRAVFGDVFAASLLAGGGTGQAGLGSRVLAIQQQFSQGNTTSTSNALDLAINGEGYYRLGELTDTDGNVSGAQSYTRNGQFHLSKDGFIVNDLGLALLGVQVNATTGVVPEITGSNIGAINVNVGVGIPKTTSNTMMLANLNSTATPPAAPNLFDVTDSTTYSNANFSRGTEIYDSQGGAHTLTYYFVKNATANVWDTFATLTDTDTTTGSEVLLQANATGGSIAQVTFDSNGIMQSVAVPDSTGTSYTIDTSGTTPKYTDPAGAISTINPLQVSFIPYSNAATGATGIIGPVATIGDATTAVATGSVGDVSIDITGVTQFNSGYSVDKMTQDGYPRGKLAALNVDADGYVQAQYDNGKTSNIARIPLFLFANQNGLKVIGDNQWIETNASGEPVSNYPGVGSAGVLQSYALEDSNVDLTAELVNLIVQQRNYQANAQTIKTQDQVMQTLVNLR